MNIIEALNALNAAHVNNERVKHFQGEIWDIEELISQIDEEELENSCEAGEWVIDGEGIEHLDANGYRDGQRYDIAPYFVICTNTDGWIMWDGEETHAYESRAEFDTFEEAKELLNSVEATEGYAWIQEQ